MSHDTYQWERVATIEELDQSLSAGAATQTDHLTPAVPFSPITRPASPLITDAVLEHDEQTAAPAQRTYPSPFTSTLGMPFEVTGQEPCTQDAANPEWWFTINRHVAVSGQRIQAQVLCEGCPMLQQCRQYAVTNGEEFGVWGGLIEADLRRLRNNRYRARDIWTLADERPLDEKRRAHGRRLLDDAHAMLTDPHRQTDRNAS